jgi:hypothetical protein
LSTDLEGRIRSLTALQGFDDIDVLASRLTDVKEAAATFIGFYDMLVASNGEVDDIDHWLINLLLEAEHLSRHSDHLLPMVKMAMMRFTDVDIFGETPP